jgi:cyclophilin family peptidyl-prolyl cis-trans isomerase
MLPIVGVAVVLSAAVCMAGTQGTPQPEKGHVEPAYKPKAGETVIKLSFKSTDAKGTGDVYIKLFTADAPKTTSHILDIVKSGYYKDILVHRKETREDFRLIQFGNAGTKKGDPTNLGEDSGTTVPLEVNKNGHLRGSVGLARTQDPNSGDSEMYICFVDIPRLNSGYAIFGTVVHGLNVAENLVVGSKIVDCKVVQDARK